MPLPCRCTRAGVRSFDDVVEILLVLAVEKAEAAAGPSASPHVHVDVGVAVVCIEIDRPGFAPKKLRTRGQNVVVEAVRRSSKKRWKGAGSLGAINPRADARPVSHCNAHVLLQHSNLPPLFFSHA